MIKFLQSRKFNYWYGVIMTLIGGFGAATEEALGWRLTTIIVALSGAVVFTAQLTHDRLCDCGEDAATHIKENS